MTEIVVKFTDYVIPYPACGTGTVAYARVAAWLMRYPNAKVIEKMGKTMMIVIEPGCACPKEFRDA